MSIHIKREIQIDLTWTPILIFDVMKMSIVYIFWQMIYQNKSEHFIYDD